jgi:hypothetical protein
MHLRNILWGVFFWQPIVALSIPQHAAQNPMLPEQQTARPITNSVILAFTSNDSDIVQHVEVTSQKQIPSGA